MRGIRNFQARYASSILVTRFHSDTQAKTTLRIAGEQLPQVGAAHNLPRPSHKTPARGVADWCGVDDDDHAEDEGLRWSAMLVNAALVVAIIFATITLTATDAHAMSRAKTLAWNRVARCESGQRWTLDTGNGFYGGLQFDVGTWRGVVASHPRLARWRRADYAPAWAQRAAAELVRRRRGLSPWPVCGRWFYA